MPDDHRENQAAATDGPALLDPGPIDDVLISAEEPASIWASAWQMPAIVLSLLLIGLGLWVASERSPEFSIAAELDGIDRLIDAGRLDEAATQLREVAEPRIDEATVPEQGRFHALVADWIAAVALTQGDTSALSAEAISRRYATAVDNGVILSPARLERWADALIKLGRINEARQRIDELEALSVTSEGSDQVRDRRNRLLRRIVELTISRPDLPVDAALEMLGDYLADPLLSPSDRGWAIARQAELRLDSGEPERAVDHLLIDMRRLEAAEPPLPPAAWADLYTLLGRGYYEQGRRDDARFHLARAIERYDTQDAGRGEALLLMAYLDAAVDRTDAALDRLDEIVLNFQETPAYLPALFARAEIRSILGRHDDALADYRLVVEALRGRGAQRGVDPARVATSLEDRHDAALAQGLLDDALEYVSIAESLFKSDNVPPGVLFRIASTSRQIADNVIARAIEAITDHPKRIEHIEPEIRHRAAEQYERAGDYFLRHARALTAVPDADDDWARSLWLAADSFDLAGRRRKAIRHFLEYIESRSIDDPRRAEATFRLAQAYHAEHDFASAATNYERVIEEHPRSPYGTRSHVPLARCYVALDRRPEAEQQLRRVLDGSYDAINPDAIDYRDALIELGVIQYESAQFVPAIERLTEAVTRYPDDERINEIRFRLADSYRRHALATREQLSTEPNLSPQQHRLLELRIDDEFESALIGFDRVCDGYLRLDPRRLNRLQRDFERNAWMYRADAAFELGRYELAVDLYDKAARRYAEHAASMHALVQIINCYELTGDARRAEVAHRNAVKRLAQLPDDVLDDPENLMDREAWERWLRRRPADRLVRTDPHEAPN